MMVLDMTAQLAPIIYGMVALLAVSTVALISVSLPVQIARRKAASLRGETRKPVVTPAAVPASA